MRPQDVVILLKKLTSSGRLMTGKELAASLCISASEVSESLGRSRVAGLIGVDKKRVNTLALKEFLVHGIQYCFPAVLGQTLRGIPTAAVELLDGEAIPSDTDVLVWKDRTGSAKGQSVAPLYPTVPEAVKQDDDLYRLLVATDMLRIGRVREREAAIAYLDKTMAAYGQ